MANKLEALRQVELQGVLAEDFDGTALSVINDNQQVVKLPFGSQYVITVNGQPVAKPSSLKRGDRVKVKHDNYITEVVAQRTLAGGGVVEQIRYEPPQTLSVAEDGGEKTTYLVGPQCKITLGDEAVPLDALRERRPREDRARGDRRQEPIGHLRHGDRGGKTGRRQRAGP